MIVEVGVWYKSKRGHFCRAELLHQDGTMTVTSHYTGNQIILQPGEVEHLTMAKEEPSTPVGSPLQIVKCDENDYSDLYTKHRHIVPGSIHKVLGTNKTMEEKFEADGKMRIKTIKSGAVGSTRCEIRCQTRKCKNTRDIKVQDAWVAKYCEACMKLRKKAALKAFLQKRKDAKKSTQITITKPMKKKNVKKPVR